jgi:hypothetical protein
MLFTEILFDQFPREEGLQALDEKPFFVFFLHGEKKSCPAAQEKDQNAYLPFLVFIS